MKKLILLILIFCLTSCGFKPRGTMPLAPPLYHLYLQSPAPYDQLTRNLRQFLKMSGVALTDNPADASATLVILNENTHDQLIGINGSQQTRQYNLILTVTFQVINNQTHVQTPVQAITETRILTITNDQILASSNEATYLYSQMRQAAVYDMMSRLSSEEMTTMITREPRKPINPIIKKSSPQKNNNKLNIMQGDF